LAVPDDDHFDKQGLRRTYSYTTAGDLLIYVITATKSVPVDWAAANQIVLDQQARL
jgi:hypothetical protein